MPSIARETTRITLAAATKVWARIALLSFGGPAGQIALMHRVLVDEEKWISERRFLHALNFCMLLPGPEAQQLATYIGWLMHGVPGGLIAGGLFIVPGVAAIMALSLVYAAYGATPALDGAFFGLKAAVLALVFAAIRRLGARALRTSSQKAIAAAAFLALFLLDAPFPLVVLGAGLVGFFGERLGLPPVTRAAAEGSDEDGLTAPDQQPDPRRALAAAAVLGALWILPVAALVLAFGPQDVYARIAVFFSKMAVVTFGGAYAALSYVAQQAVERFHWMTPPEMLDGLGMAETTPGPLIMVLQFVGFMAAFRAPGALSPLAAGALGGLLATYVTFVPCFLWIFAGAPFVERLRGNAALAGALSAIAAAVVGVIANLALWFATHFLFGGHWRLGLLPAQLPDPATLDPAALALSLAAGALLRFGLAPALALSVGAGLLLKLI
ncbi:chromate efflux transporter [Methylocystis sp. IM3]|uniref:chromate efflux transporter n=1 Tax=unclassified Methylocystis TaxID=2625913 RepID=UPI00311A0681